MPVLPRLALPLLLSLPAIGAGTSVGSTEESGLRVQAQICTARGDLKDLAGNRLGYGLGLHGLLALDSRRQFRPRLDWAFYPMLKLSGIQNTASSLSLGCDYLQFLRGRASDLYLVSGAAAVRWSARDATGSDTTKLGLALGLGYKLSDAVGYEARASYAPLAGHSQATTLSLGLTCRF